MPEQNGLDVVKSLRAYLAVLEERYGVTIKKPLVVILTAFASINLRKHLQSHQIELVYEKPLSID
jgi:hypothetical protein